MSSLLLFFCKCIFTTLDTVSVLIFFSKQYLLLSQSSSLLFPLLALQDPQHNAILFESFILMSLIMCSQVFLVFLFLSEAINEIPQYTQFKSLSNTIFSTSCGIPQRFAMIDSLFV